MNKASIATKEDKEFALSLLADCEVAKNSKEELAVRAFHAGCPTDEDYQTALDWIGDLDYVPFLWGGGCLID